MALLKFQEVVLTRGPLYKASINAWTKKYREECSDKNSNAEYSLNKEIAQLKHQLAEKEKEILF